MGLNTYQAAQALGVSRMLIWQLEKEDLAPKRTVQLAMQALAFQRGPPRDAIAREAALHGLGRLFGAGSRKPPNERWTQGEWERRILECVPGDVERQCYALADAILALSGSPLTSTGCPPSPGNTSNEKESEG